MTCERKYHPTSPMYKFIPFLEILCFCEILVISKLFQNYFKIAYYDFKSGTDKRPIMLSYGFFSKLQDEKNLTHDLWFENLI